LVVVLKQSTSAMSLLRFLPCSTHMHSASIMTLWVPAASLVMQGLAEWAARPSQPIQPTSTNLKRVFITGNLSLLTFACVGGGDKHVCDVLAETLALQHTHALRVCHDPLSASCSCDARIGGCRQNGLLVPRSPFSQHPPI
jgi:hypothetical protein